MKNVFERLLPDDIITFIADSIDDIDIMCKFRQCTYNTYIVISNMKKFNRINPNISFEQYINNENKYSCGIRLVCNNYLDMKNLQNIKNKKEIIHITMSFPGVYCVYRPLNIMYSNVLDISNTLDINDLLCMVNLKSLILTRYLIVHNLEELCKLTKLETLKLYKNEILDLNFIRNMKIKKLHVDSMNRTSPINITELPTCKLLNHLTIYYFSDYIHTLKKCTSLKSMLIYTHEIIIDLSILDNLSDITIRNSNCTLYKLLLNKNIVNIDISTCGIRKFLSLPPDNIIKKLDISNTLIEIISHRLPHLEILYARNCKNLKDIKILSESKNLKQIYISYTIVDNIECFSELDKLEDVDLSSTNIENISFLSKCTKLKVLNIRCCRGITDISVISNFINLNELYIIGSCRIKSLSDISNCKNLTILDAGHCNLISDCSCITGFLKLRKVSFSYCRMINNWQPLATCPNLKELSINNCSNTHGIREILNNKDIVIDDEIIY